MSANLHATLDLGGFYALRDQTQRRLVVATARAADVGAKAGVAHAKKGRFKDRTGRLRSEIHAEPAILGPAAFEWDIVSATPYAPFIEYGTRPHWIRPRKVRGFIGPLQEHGSRRKDGGHERAYLRFVVNGRVVFAKEVDHPGNDPIPFMRPGGEVAGEMMAVELERHFIGIAALWR
jgi:hypothetical protein